MELEKKKARESYLNFGFLTKKQYEPPSWASNLCPIPSHVYSLGHFPTPIHKWNLPNLPKNTEVWLKECNEVETRSGNLNFCWLMLWHREQTAYNYWRFPNGGTIAGLSIGSWLSNLKAKVHAFCVCDDPGYFYYYVQGLLDGLHAGVSSHDIVDIQIAKGLGYAMNTIEELNFVKEIAETTGIVLDPVYSSAFMN